jgi:tellurite resistance protein TehA-like permease
METSRPAHPIDRLLHHAGDVRGGGFAFVMATGIVSIAAGSLSFNLVAVILFAINLAGFAVLTMLLLRRLLRHPGAVVSELSHHPTAAGFLTFAAAVAILGNEFAILTACPRIAAGLWLIGCVIWAGLIYAFFALLTVRPARPTQPGVPNGSWLLIVVATEALAVLGTYVGESFARPAIVVWLSLCLFLLGTFFYLIVIQMIIRRWLLHPSRAGDLTPSYWINMGAMAIATLAGARLEVLSDTAALPAALLPAIGAATMLCWTTAAWWIPLLAILTIWRHTAGGVPRSYDFEHWSAVFPLGMFTVATWTWSHVNHFDFLYWIPRLFFWIAILGWVACFAGMIRRGFTSAVLSN